MDILYFTHEQHEAIEKLFVGLVFFGAIIVFIFCKMKWWTD